MYGTGNKKMLNMLILEILRTYTDEDHSLTQQEIIKLLSMNYGMICDRRSVKNNILSLKEMGYDISMTHGYRLLSREFDDAELRLLIDGVLFSKSISTKQAQSLIEKLKGLGSRYFNAKTSNVRNLQELPHTENKQTLYALDALNDAIDHRKKVSFTYNEMGTDLKLHPRRHDPYIVNPYAVAAGANGRFYLIGNVDKYDDVAHFRVDRMTCVEILATKVKPMKDVEGLEHGLDLPKHLAEHIYMFSGPSVDVKLKTASDMMNDLTDWFGRDMKITKTDEDHIIVRLRCNYDAMRYWGLQFGPFIEILEPEDLREQLLEDARDMVRKYSGKEK